MPSIFKKYTLPLDGTPEIVRGDHYGVAITMAEYALNGSVITATTGSVNIEWSYDGTHWQAFEGGVYSLPSSPSGAIASAAVRYVRATGAVTGADSVIVEFRLENDGINSRVVSSPAVEAFAQGRAHRMNFPFTISNNGDPIYLKFNIHKSINLTLSTLDVDQGGVELKVYSVFQATETSPFTEVVATQPRNYRVIKDDGVTIETGGEATFVGDETSTLRVRTSGGSNKSDSNVAGEQTERGFPVTTAYVEIAALDGVNSETTGVYKLEWYTL